MFPMVSGVQELRAAKAILEECKEELRREGIALPRTSPVGIMASRCRRLRGWLPIDLARRVRLSRVDRHQRPSSSTCWRSIA